MILRGILTQLPLNIYFKLFQLIIVSLPAGHK